MLLANACFFPLLNSATFEVHTSLCADLNDCMSSHLKSDYSQYSKQLKHKT